LPDSDSESEISSSTESTNLMTPSSRRVMHAFTPRRRKAFEMVILKPTIHSELNDLYYYCVM